MKEWRRNSPTPPPPPPPPPPQPMNTVGKEETLARGRGHEEVSRPATNILSVKQRYYHFYCFHDREITLFPFDVGVINS